MLSVCSLVVQVKGARVILSPVAPRTLADAGLASRYYYFSGRSGRRYLFTATDHRSLEDFGEGVAICVVGGQVIRSGEVSAVARLPRTAGLNRPAYYVHLLAASPGERAAIAEDLAPETLHYRLAA
jgi:hypothetical protein